MARKRRESGGSDSGAWMNTYADMVTLLLTFFILLYSMSSLDSTKFNIFVEAFTERTGEFDSFILYLEGIGAESDLQYADSPELVKIENLNDVFERLDVYVRENNLEQNISVSQGDGYVFISFADDMLFEPNSARLNSSILEILHFIGQGIKSIEDEVEMISVNGHTAAIPGNPDYAVSDRLLSSDRANAVLMYFEEVMHIDSTKLVQIGFGKYKPLEDNETEEGRRRNRRVEILISSDNPITNQIDNVYEQLVE